MPCKDPVARAAYEKKRYAANRQRLLAASKIRGAAWNAANRQRISDNSKAYRVTHKEQTAATTKAWGEVNKERRAARAVITGAVYRERNKVHAAARTRAYRDARPGYRRVLHRQYALAKERATPPWVDRATITAIYANCPDGYHVDHVYPLHGKTVSGLHVPENLQYLPAVENMSKGNKFDPSSTVPSGLNHSTAL